jgi:class 3 adenylate cyclase/HAMP domain-containing protein
MRLVLRVAEYLEQFEVNFEQCIALKEVRILLKEHLLKSFNYEPLEYLEAVEEYKLLETDQKRYVRALEIFKDHISDSGTKQINLPADLTQLIQGRMNNTSHNSCPVDLFEPTVANVMYSIQVGWFGPFCNSAAFHTWLFDNINVHGEEFMERIAVPIVDEVRSLHDFLYSSSTKQQETNPESKTSAAAYIAASNISTVVKRERTQPSKGIGRTIVESLCAIRFILPIAFLLQLIVGSLFVFLLTYLTSQNSINNVTNQLETSILLRINDVTENLLSIPPIMTNLAALELKSGVWDYNFGFALANQTYRLAQAFPQTSQVYMGTEDGGSYTGHERYTNGTLVIYQKPPNSPDRFVYFCGPDGRPRPDWGPVATRLNYDSRTRPWYLTAKNAGRSLWQTIYTFTNNDLGASYVAPIYTNNATTGQSQFRGVLAVDYTLAYLNNFLLSLYVSPNGRTFIMDTTGLFVAASKGGISDGNQLSATKSSDSMIAAAAMALNSTYGGFSKILTPTRNSTIDTLKLGGQDCFVQAKRFLVGAGELEWIIVVIIPVNDIMGTVLTGNIIIYVLVSVGFVISVIAALVLSFCITRPLSRISDQMMQVSTQMNLEQVSEKDSASILSEVRSMQFSFFSMIYALKSFRKYVPDNVILSTPKIVANEKKLTRQNASYLFLDIKNFDHITEMLPPQDLQNTLADFMIEISSIIQEENGFVDKYVGNSIMTVFGVQSSEDTHQYNACCAALKIVRRLHEKGESWKEKGFPALRCTIGIHCGSSLIGNFGRSEYKNLTAMGRAVNIASNIEPLCAQYGVDILISSDMYNAVKKDFCARAVDLYHYPDEKAFVMYELLNHRDGSRTSFVSDFASDQELRVENVCNEMAKMLMEGDRLGVLRCIEQATAIEGYENDKALDLLKNGPSKKIEAHESVIFMGSPVL